MKNSHTYDHLLYNYLVRWSVVLTTKYINVCIKEPEFLAAIKNKHLILFVKILEHLFFKSFVQSVRLRKHKYLHKVRLE